MHSDFKVSHVIIEESSVSIHTLQIIKQYGQISPHPYIPDKGKVVRANDASYYVREGRVLLPINAHWLPDFMNEINAFPMGKHDDQVDALTQLIAVAFSQQFTLNNIAEAIKRSQNIESPFSSAKAMCLFAQSKINKNWHKYINKGDRTW